MKKATVAILASIICITFALCRKASKPLPGLEEFRQEIGLHRIAQTVRQFSVIPYNDSVQILKAYTIMQYDLDYLVNKYGKQRAKEFAFRMLKTTQTGSASNRLAATSCCRLSPDGTTDQSCCNFWESIVVAFETLDCTRPYPGASLREIQDFYECIQAEVCENC